MSEWSVEYTETAEQNLRSIYEYIAFTLLEPETAAAQARRIMDAITELNHMPLRHPLYPKEPWQGRGLRYMPIDNYLVFYFAYEAESLVSIMSIMCGASNIAARLQF